MPGLHLQGFNNLTKTLSFNIYDISYAATPKQRERYLAYIDAAYSTARLIQILSQVCQIIGATILNIACQDYEPRGASATLLIAEEPIAAQPTHDTKSPGPRPDAVVCHLDKSHITVHTYPESHPDNGVSTFRTDIEVSTCGRISPLKALNYLIHSFESDIVILDYRVRGFTRDVTGRKHFIDHPIDSIQNILSKDICERYQMIDVNIDQERTFHTKMILKDFELNNYLFSADPRGAPPRQQAEIERRLRREIAEIFHGEDLHEGVQV
ncbi:MAG: adenosylmethionine decarboxylase [Gammaproteobacteria bacterium]|nr:adenosylmethionine decarboxylase [Gammaproteobacteria bacterium]